MNYYNIRAYLEILIYIAMLLCIFIDLLFSILFAIIALVQIIKNNCREETIKKFKFFLYKGRRKVVSKENKAGTKKESKSSNNNDNQISNNEIKSIAVPSKNQPNSRVLQIFIKPRHQNTNYKEENKNNPDIYEDNSNKKENILENIPEVPDLPPNFHLEYPNIPPKYNSTFTQENEIPNNLENQYNKVLFNNETEQYKKPRINYVNSRNLPLEKYVPRSKLINEIRRDHSQEDFPSRKRFYDNNLDSNIQDNNPINRLLKRDSPIQLPKKNEKSLFIHEDKINEDEITNVNRPYNKVGKNIFHHELTQIMESSSSPRKNLVVIKINPEDRKIDYSRLQIQNSSPYSSNIANIVSKSLNHPSFTPFNTPNAKYHPPGKIFKNF